MHGVYTDSDRKVELADLGTRLLAFALDLLLLFTLIGITDVLTFSSDDKALLLKPERWLHFFLGWLYFAGAETCACQGTLGKYLMGLRVTSASGARLSFRNATIRYFAKPMTVAAILLRFVTGAPCAARRTLHDRLANAQVVPR